MNNFLNRQQVVAIVDDDRSVLKGLQRVLQASGIKTQVFSSAEAFLDNDGAADVMCVILDIHLRGISGIELRRRLSARGLQTPVIFMTAFDTAATRKEASDVGCAAFLGKPISGRVLIEAIRKAASPSHTVSHQRSAY